MTRLLKLAWRSLWRNRRRTLLTVSSIALGLSIAIFFVALAEGVYAKLVADAVRMMGGHFTLESPDYRDAPAVDLVVGNIANLRRRIEELPGVEGTKALVLGQGVARSSSGAVGVSVMGVEPSREATASPLAKKIVAGGYLDDGDDRRVVIGRQLARQLKLGIDKKLVITTNNVRGELVEELVRVKGVFDVGTPEIDGYLIQVPIEFARRLYGISPDEATQLGVVVGDPPLRDRLLGRVQGWVDPARVAVLAWEKVMPDLAAYIRVDGGSNLIFQGILIFLILFTIFNTILMSVLERQREFAILLAIGTPSYLLRVQILLETALIGLLGCAAGLLVGGLASYAAQVHGIDMRSFMKEGISVSGLAVDPMIQARLTAGLMISLGAIVFLATVFLSLYPMRRAARIPVADVLR